MEKPMQKCDPRSHYISHHLFSHYYLFYISLLNPQWTLYHCFTGWWSFSSCFVFPRTLREKESAKREVRPRVIEHDWARIGTQLSMGHTHNVYTNTLPIPSFLLVMNSSCPLTIEINAIYLQLSLCLLVNFWRSSCETSTGSCGGGHSSSSGLFCPAIAIFNDWEA